MRIYASSDLRHEVQVISLEEAEVTEASDLGNLLQVGRDFRRTHDAILLNV